MLFIELVYKNRYQTKISTPLNVSESNNAPKTSNRYSYEQALSAYAE